MKCRYKEPMECFYLTKDNYGKFLKKIYGNNYNDDYIIMFHKGIYGEYIEIKSKRKFGGYDKFYLNKYYVEGYDYSDWDEYSKEEFEEIFEVIEE